MANNRMGRVDSEITKALCEILRRVKNTDVTEMVNVLRVETTKDLKHCKVFLSIYSNDKERRDKTFSGIVASSGFIRYELGHAVSLRCVPELHFQLDDSMEYSMHINKIISEINKEN